MMILSCACRHCGVVREWEKGKDGVIRPRKTDGPYGVGHYSLACTVSPSGTCDVVQESSGDKMIRELAEIGARQRLGPMKRMRAKR